MLGIVGAPCTYATAKETSQPGATVVAENVAHMISHLSPGSFGKAVWLCHSSVLPQLFTRMLKVRNSGDTDWVGGAPTPWFQVLPNGEMSLVGRPLIVTDRLPVLGTVGDLVLADLRQYIMALRQDATLAIDTSKGFAEGEVYFEVTLRVDRAPLLNSAITPKVGTAASLSPFVTLATRS